MKINKFIKSIYGRKMYYHVIPVMVLAFGGAVAQFMATQYLGLIIDAVAEGYDETISYFCRIVVALLIYIVGSGAFTFLSGKIAAGFVRRLQTRIGEKLCSACYREIEQMAEGELLTIADKDVVSLKNWLEMLLKMGVLPATLGLGPICLFRWCSWKFSLLIVGLIPLSAVTNVLLARKLPSFYDREKKAYAGVLSLFTATIQFLMMIKSFRLEPLFRQKNRDELNSYIKMRKKRMLYESLVMEYGRWFGHISRIVMLLLGAYFIFIGEMTLGRLTSVILVSDFVGEGMQLLGNIPSCRQNAKVSAIRVNRLLEMEDETDKENGVQTTEQPNHKPVYKVQGLSFSYGGTLALHDVDFRVEEGEKIAIVGPSGCGKTTLFKLLSGLYIPEKNQIYFRGMDLADLSSGYLKNKITATTQETFLFQSTMRDNIRVARPDGTEEEIAAACKNARIDAFIGTLPCGYDTEVNTTVQSVSKGQMQRINLARAFLRNTEIFLLDEPTSALDIDTARQIWDYLFSKCADKTLLVILHDLEEIYRFDKILVLDNGEAVGFGTHKELLQSCGRYRQLYREKLSNQRKGGM